jgi:hypothetical protein
MTEPVIRMDRSKKPPPSTVHGDRTPDDPHYRVAYWHQGLPYDVNEVLIQPDERSEPWDVLMDNGDGTQRRIRYSPLYDKKSLEKLAKLKERLTKVHTNEAVLPADALEDEPAASIPSLLQDDEDDDVNFVSFLRGEVKYPFYKVAAAFKKRKFRTHNNLRDLIIDLVEEEKVIPEDQVAPQYLKLIGPKGSE